MQSVHQPSRFLGIDVAKDTLVVCLDGTKKTRKFTNDEPGIQALLNWLGEEASSYRATMEATSRYHRLAERTLVNAGISVELVNPRRARSLAIGLGLTDKDDAVDARVLAEAARLLQAQARQLESLAAQDLKDHSRAIDAVKSDASDFLKRMDGLDKDSPAYQAFQKAAKLLKALAVSEERLWEKQVAQDPETQRRYTLAKTVPDVGHVTARIASVELPAHMEGANTRKLTAYAGLAPRRHQSGNMELEPRIYGGNAHLRTGLFMAAIHAVYQGQKRYSAYYNQLAQRSHICIKSKGGRHLKAIVAVMRKVLANIIAVIQRNSPWETTPPRENLRPKPWSNSSTTVPYQPLIDNS